MVKEIIKDCIFCGIVSGEIFSNKIYEDKDIIGILETNPLSKGHVLIIPKVHSDDIFSISDFHFKSVALSVKKVALKLKDRLKADGINVLHASGKDAQQLKEHFHVNLVPRYKNDGLDCWPKTNYTENDLSSIGELLK